MLTAEDISLKVGITKQAVRKKSFLAKYLLKECSYGGRPMRFYSEEVLKEFGITASGGSQSIGKVAEPESIIKPEPEEKLRKRSRNSSAGRTRLISEELEAMIKTLALRYYLEQSRKENIEQACEWACRDLWSKIQAEIKGEKTLEQFAWYFYNKRVMRRDAAYTGYCHSENWRILWDSEHNKNKYNSSIATNRWENTSLFKDAGLAGQGFGAGMLWVADGTAFDAWTDENGKATMMSYLTIMDALTGMPLFLDFLEKGESIESVADLFWKAVQLHGKPKFGIVLDNGSAFKSKEIRHMIRSWYTPQELDDMANNDFRKRLFDGQTEPYIYPQAKIPRYPFKAALERQFDELNRYMSENLPLSFIGTRDSRAVAHELGSTPTRGVKARPSRQQAFAGFLQWIYDDFIYRRQPKHEWLRKEGLEPNLVNAWQYFGGKYSHSSLHTSQDISTAIVPASISNILPEKARFFAMYAAGVKHKVKASLGHLSLAERNENYTYVSEFLDITLAGKPVSVVADGDRCVIMKEHSKSEFDPRTPNVDSLYFVGVGDRALIDSVEALSRRHRTTEVRKAIEISVKEHKEKAAGGKIQVTNKLPAHDSMELGSWHPAGEIETNQAELYTLDELLDF